MTTIRWIALDAVGTLMFPAPDVATAYAAIGRKYSSRLSADDLRSGFRRIFAESTVACLPHENGDILTSEELETRRWRWIVERMLPDVSDPAACFAELYDHFARPENWRLFDDVRPALEQLQRDGFRLALASNFDQRLRTICEGFAEFRSIERIVVSTDAGACKPSARFFAALLLACDCRADEIVMVGDEIEADVVGPRNSGIRAVHIDRDSSESNAIRSLAELSAMVIGLRNGKRS